MTETSRSFIVVGVDGSDASKDALRWAAGQAEMTGAGLHVICAWEFPAVYGPVPTYPELDIAAEAGKGLDATIAEVLGETPTMPLVTRVEQGHAAEVLAEASRGADLLVVGSRGHGAFAGMLLGSVSQHCSQHAHSPVLIMRGGRD